MEAILNSLYRTGTPRTAGHFARSIKAGLRRAFDSPALLMQTASRRRCKQPPHSAKKNRHQGGLPGGSMAALAHARRPSS